MGIDSLLKFVGWRIVRRFLCSTSWKLCLAEGVDTFSFWILIFDDVLIGSEADFLNLFWERHLKFFKSEFDWIFWREEFSPWGLPRVVNPQPWRSFTVQRPKKILQKEFSSKNWTKIIQIPTKSGKIHSKNAHHPTKTLFNQFFISRQDNKQHFHRLFHEYLYGKRQAEEWVENNLMDR